MPTVAVIGAGPAGLYAAELLAAASCAVTVYDQMPSVGRKLLMAGRGGLNLTHSEPLATFIGRYGAQAGWLGPMLEAVPPAALVNWAEGLDQPTFVGSSGRVFPVALKASPLLRGWLARLAVAGVDIKARHQWQGWTRDGALRFEGPLGEVVTEADATVLALGGASWPRLGSDGAWTAILAQAGVQITPLRPANMGVEVAWSPTLRAFAGQPLKSVALSFQGAQVRGEVMVTDHGLEGGAIYALAAPLRDALATGNPVILEIDLRPATPTADLAARLARPRGGQSLANHLRRTLRLSPLEINLLREGHGKALPADVAALAAALKAVPIRLAGARPLSRAISTAGGVAREALDADLMLHARPGVFVAGEMLDWEAPTGGYLLQGAFATAAAAARGVLQRLGSA